MWKEIKDRLSLAWWCLKGNRPVVCLSGDTYLEHCDFLNVDIVTKVGHKPILKDCLVLLDVGLETRSFVEDRMYIK